MFWNIELPVSFGEAIDKLTILDIKCGKLTDERKNDVLKEYNAIYEKIGNKIDTIKYFYEMLKRINLDIWNMQDDFRFGIKDKATLCKEIIKENDRRFLVKNKINNILSSDIREQKAYKKRKAFFVGQLDLSDCINMIGAVRYLSTIYDEVVVVCKNIYIDNMKTMYENDDTIKFYEVSSEKGISPKGDLFKRITDGFDVYLIGHFRDTHSDFNYIPYSFYDDINLPRTYFWEYSHFPDTEKSRELFELTKDKLIDNKKYIFIHNDISSDILFDPIKIFRQLGIDDTKYFIINPNSNCYEKEHSYCNLAQKFIGHLVIDYTILITNAEYNILSDSSFLYLALQLDIKTNNNYYMNGFIDHIWDGYEKFYKKKFIPLLNDKSTESKILSNKNLRMLLDGYVIDYKLDDKSYDYTALGIGDILFSLYLLKSGDIKNYIYINLNYFNDNRYYPDPINALEFKIHLINNICQYNKIDKTKIKYIFDINDGNIILNQHLELIKNIKRFELDINKVEFSPKLTEILDNKEYIVFHTKCRFFRGYNYNILKKNLRDFYAKYRSKYKILLLGERTIPVTGECELHGITTIYDELLNLKPHNNVDDLTRENIYDKLNYDNFVYDINIMKKAKYNICVGVGGQFTSCIFFTNNTITFVDNNENLDIVNCVNVLQYKNNKDYFDKLDKI